MSTRMLEGLAGIDHAALAQLGSAGTRATGPLAPRSNCSSNKFLESTICSSPKLMGIFRTIIRIPLRRRIWPI
jgi:hypothetical protein